MIDVSTLPEHKRSYGHDGYVYVLEFSTGIVKVGKTRNPRACIATHVDDARKFGATVDQLWLSEWHENYSDNERALLRALGGDSVAHGNEYLRISFMDAVDAAKRLSLTVLTEQEQAARDAAILENAHRRAQSLLGSNLIRGFTVQVPDELTAQVLQTVFSTALPTELHRSDDRAALHARITQFADDSGLDAEEILHWSYTDVITHLAEMVIKAGCLELEIRALKAERYDLTHEPFFGGVA